MVLPSTRLRQSRMTVSGPEAQIEKRRQLEKRLQQDYEELEILQQSLTKTTIFTEKVVRRIQS